MSPTADLDAWQKLLATVEADLREREQRALRDDPTPQELLAFATERDKLATDQDALADAKDEQASQRDSAALGRDVRGSGRDRRTREFARDRDQAATDRFLAGADRDLAAGDRGDSVDDRGRASQARHDAADNRERAADDRDQAASREEEASREIDHLRAALDSRLVIGQAEGLLMARYDFDPDASSRLLSRLSQETRTQLRDVAARIVADATRSAWSRGAGA